MKQNQDGPYKHYERPTELRVTKSKAAMSTKPWIVAVAALLVILILLLPVTHYFANNVSVWDKSSTVNKNAATKKKHSPKTKKKRAVYYVVKDGDTLSSIAVKHDISLKKLGSLNNLDESSSVILGQKLRIK